MRNSNISDFVLYSGTESFLWPLNRFSCPENGLEIFERKSSKNQLLLLSKEMAHSACSQVEFIPETDNPEVSFIKKE
jgi:hypothetical protein